MASSPLKKFLLPPVVLSGVVFCFLTSPLAVFGSRQITIQFQEEPIFYGKLRDIGAPYLGFATALSLGIAASSVAVTGWRQSSQKATQIKKQLSTVKQNLQETEIQLEKLKVSELQLQTSGLNVFLEEKASGEQLLSSPVATTISHPAAVATPVQVPRLVATTAQPVKPQPSMSPPVSVSPTQSRPISVTADTTVSETTSLVGNNTAEISLATLIAQAQTEPLKQIQELQGQFQQVMAQMDTLQEIILAKTQPVTLEAELLAHHNRYSDNQFNRQQPVLEFSQAPANFHSAQNPPRCPRPVLKAQRQQQKLVAS